MFSESSNAAESCGELTEVFFATQPVIFTHQESKQGIKRHTSTPPQVAYF